LEGDAAKKDAGRLPRTLETPSVAQRTLPNSHDDLHGNDKEENVNECLVAVQVCENVEPAVDPPTVDFVPHLHENKSVEDDGPELRFLVEQSVGPFFASAGPVGWRWYDVQVAGDTTGICEIGEAKHPRAGKQEDQSDGDLENGLGQNHFPHC
jgi:hypothetical protein